MYIAVGTTKIHFVYL